MKLFIELFHSMDDLPNAFYVIYGGFYAQLVVGRYSINTEIGVLMISHLLLVICLVR